MRFRLVFLLLLLLLFLLLPFTSLWAGQAQAVLLTLSQPNLIAGEQLELLVEATSRQATEPPLVLPKSWQTHFELLDQIHQVEARPRGEYRHRWFLVLQHQQADSISRFLKLTPLQVDGKNSQPLQVLIEAARKSPQLTQQRFNQPLTMQQQVDFSEAYIGQTLVYELLIRYQGFPIEPRLSPLEVTGATARQLGDGREQGFNQRGVKWQEARWQELIQLHTSEAVVAPRFFSTRLNFNKHTSSQLYEAQAPELMIKVRPIPNAWPEQQPWLPALEVNLEAAFLPRPRQVQQEQALELTIHLDVVGQQARNLPQFKSLVSDNWRIEPLTEELSDRVIDGLLVGSLKQRLLFYPKQVGNLKLPNLTVHWWDTRAHKAAKSQVVLGQLEVLASDATLLEAKKPVDKKLVDKKPEKLPKTTINKSHWLGGLLISLALLSVMVVGIGLLKTQPKAPPLPPLNP